MLKEAFLEARQAAVAPRDYFALPPLEESWSGPAARLAFWSLAAGAAEVALSIASGHRVPGDILVDILTLLVFPALGLLAGFCAALALHGLWRTLGGKGTLKASWWAAAGVAFTMPLDILMRPLGILALAPALWRYALLAHAGQGVHGLTKRRAYGLSSALAALHLLALALT